jgi:hypothetical protein
MTGPEHYREAERLIDEDRKAPWDDGDDVARSAAMMAAAQVHATLALAASTVDVQKVGRAINEAVREARRSSW